MRRHQTSSRSSRLQVAAVAARAIADDSAGNFDQARNYAARALGLDGKSALPSNLEIHQALVGHLSLFAHDRQSALLSRLRTAARGALEYFAIFQPRLCGPVWYGTATQSSPITVHLISDEIEAVTRFLLERKIPYTLTERHFRFASSNAPTRMPQFDLVLAGEQFEFPVFPHSGPWRHPLSALDARPVKRVGMRELEVVIESGLTFPDARSVPA